MTKKLSNQQNQSNMREIFFKEYDTYLKCTELGDMEQVLYGINYEDFIFNRANEIKYIVKRDTQTKKIYVARRPDFYERFAKELSQVLLYSK